MEKVRIFGVKPRGMYFKQIILTSTTGKPLATDCLLYLANAIVKGQQPE